MIEAFRNGDHDTARSIHYQYLLMFKGLFAAPNPTCVKYALSALGLCSPNLRLPLVPLNPSQKKIIDDILAKANLREGMQPSKSKAPADAMPPVKAKAKVRA